MVATIRVSPYILVQGMISRTLPDGLIAIRDGEQEYVGRPVHRTGPADLSLVDRGGRR